MAKLLDDSYPGEIYASNDRETARCLSLKLAEKEPRREVAVRIEAEARSRVRKKLNDPKTRALIDALALALLKKSPLKKEEIRGILGAVGTEAPD
jgi:hypothetical protein